jgi:flavorubredoxin
MTRVDEIAPDVYRICTYVAEFDLQFNQFLVKDDEPLLYHTGLRGLFPAVQEAVAGVIEPSRIRWIGGSHFEMDEFGSINEWLAAAPSAQAFATVVGAAVNLQDLTVRPPRALTADDVLSTGKYRFRLHPTPHLPHGWDAGMLFEETQRTLLCTDLFHQSGNGEALTDSDVVEKARQTLVRYQCGPLANYMPYTPKTGQYFQQLAALKPKTVATMHGAAFAGDGERALRDLAVATKEVLGGQS